MKFSPASSSRQARSARARVNQPKYDPDVREAEHHAALRRVGDEVLAEFKAASRMGNTMRAIVFGKGGRTAVRMQDKHEKT